MLIAGPRYPFACRPISQSWTKSGRWFSVIRPVTVVSDGRSRFRRRDKRDTTRLPEAVASTGIDADRTCIESRVSAPTVLS